MSHSGPFGIARSEDNSNKVSAFINLKLLYMFVIKKMRLNKFQPRPIVSNRELAMSLGDNHPATIQSKDTADCYNQPCIDGASKTKVLGLAQSISTAAIKHQQDVDAKQLNKDQGDL